MVFYTASLLLLFFFFSITSNQGTHFISNEVRQWVHAHGIHWSYHVIDDSEATDVVER